MISPRPPLSTLLSTIECRIVAKQICLQGVVGIGRIHQTAGATALRALALPMFSALAIIRPWNSAMPAQISAG